MVEHQYQQFMKRLILVFAAAVLCGATRLGAYDMKGDLHRLDAALQMSDEYDAHKRELISSLEEMIASDRIDDSQRKNLMYLLYEEYYTYSFPMASATLDRLQSVTTNREISIGGGRLIDDINISRAKLLSAAGMFLEAKEVIENVDTLSLTNDQKQRFFSIAKKSYWGYREYGENLIDRSAVMEKIQYYGNRLDRLPNKDTTILEYREIQVTTLISEGRYDEVDRICDYMIGLSTTNSHYYGVFTYYKAAINEYQGKMEEAVHWYAESAINDARLAVKENASLYSLAKILLGYGDVERSFRYTSIALKDALQYGSRLRPFQIGQSFPDIQNAYEVAQQRQKRITNLFIALMTLIAALFLVVIVFLIVMVSRQRKAHAKIKHMGDELQQMVQSLSEANAAKEEYLGLFLSMCSGYLDKMKKHLSMSQMEEELKFFYTTFDQAFLHLYPNFVADFNGLLKSDEQIELKKNELLNTELRIFALIRLGITQSSHIASLLRYSVNTIYNYRAQVKKAALGDPETFEERVKTL